MENFECLVTPGGLREAILHSCQANAVHGLRRSDEDKRRAVKVLLADKEWATWSDREIARRCQVSHTLVARIREKLTPLTGNVASEDRTYRTKHGSVATMKTAAIGVRPPVNQVDLPGQAMPTDIAPPAPDKRTAPKHRLSDAPPPHVAITILARSICDVPATAEEVVGGCADDEERNDLREVSVAAVTKLREVLVALPTSCHSKVEGPANGARETATGSVPFQTRNEHQAGDADADFGQEPGSSATQPWRMRMPL